MRFQHRFSPLLFFSSGDDACVLLHLFAFWSGRAIRADFENLVEPKSGKKLATAIATMNNVEMALPDSQERILRELCGKDAKARANVVWAMDGKPFRCSVGAPEAFSPTCVSPWRSPRSRAVRKSCCRTREPWSRPRCRNWRAVT